MPKTDESTATKHCRKCDTEKSLDEFSRNSQSKDGLRTVCKKCGNAQSAVWRATNPEKVKAHNAAWYAANTEKARANNAAWWGANPGRRRNYDRKSLLKKHGITPEEFDAMLAEQDGLCAICGTDEPGGYGIFHVDHCHDTGKVRGLLCHHCNLGIGNLGDDADRVLSAAAYLLRGAQTSDG